jgi:steroid 5-alpha reductase family enzyme
MTESPYLLSALVITALMLCTWLLSLVQRNASLIDIGWGLGFVLIGVACYLQQSKIASGQSGLADELLLLLIVLWGLRLSAYLCWRNWGKPEDYRYAAMREKWGNRFGMVSLLTVFGLQGAIMWLVSLPIQQGIGYSNSSSFGFLLLGALLWLIGWSFETVGDWQLAKFKANPNNRQKVCDQGLWKYTRHPNYFGDFLVWWGFYLLSIAQGAAWWTVVSPLVMSFLLMRVSGVPLLEKAMVESKPGYSDYLKRTNAFFPGLPKTHGGS